MLAVEYTNAIDNFKDLYEKAHNGETVVVSHLEDQKIYMINETEYNKMKKAKENADYLVMLSKSEEQLQKGETITFTFEELKEMEAEDWKPTQKVLEFERKHGIQRQGIKEDV